MQEIDRRKLYTQFRCGSLFEYCEKVLKYSGGSASRRIYAMRLLKKLPAVEAKLQEGSLTLGHLSQIAPFAKQHDLNLEKVSDLLKSVVGSSTRQCQSTLAALAPETSKPDLSRPIGNELTEIRFYSFP